MADKTDAEKIKEVITTDDGWYECPDHPQQHYFFKKRALCGIYKEYPPGAHHDNVPLRHCQKCKQTVNKLFALASAIHGKDLDTKQIFNLLEALNKISLNKGAMMKVKFPEERNMALNTATDDEIKAMYAGAGQEPKKNYRQHYKPIPDRRNHAKKRK